MFGSTGGQTICCSFFLATLLSLGGCSGDDVAERIEDALGQPTPAASPAPSTNPGPTAGPQPTPSGSPVPTPAPTMAAGSGVGRLAYFVDSDPAQRLEVADLSTGQFAFKRELELNGASSFAIARSGTALVFAGTERQQSGFESYCTRVDLQQGLLEDDCLPANIAIAPTVIGMSDDGRYTGLLWLDISNGLLTVGRWSATAGIEVFGTTGSQWGLAALSPDGQQIFLEEVVDEQVTLVSFTSAGPTGFRLMYPAEVIGGNRSTPNIRMRLAADGQRLLTSVILDSGRTAGLSVDLASNAITLYRYPARIRSLSPNGQQIFGVQAESGEALFFNFGNPEAATRVDADGDVDYLSWSPDSSRVVFRRKNSRDIFRSTVARLPDGDGVREGGSLLEILRIDWSE